jgi:hypothetical protein
MSSSSECELCTEGLLPCGASTRWQEALSRVVPDADCRLIMNSPGTGMDSAVGLVVGKVTTKQVAAALAAFRRGRQDSGNHAQRHAVRPAR